MAGRDEFMEEVVLIIVAGGNGDRLGEYGLVGSETFAIGTAGLMNLALALLNTGLLLAGEPPDMLILPPPDMNGGSPETDISDLARTWVSSSSKSSSSNNPLLSLAFPPRRSREFHSFLNLFFR
jgi:hypothetical protein